MWIPMQSNEYNLTRPIDKYNKYTLTKVTNGRDRISHVNYFSFYGSLRGRGVSWSIGAFAEVVLMYNEVYRLYAVIYFRARWVYFYIARMVCFVDDQPPRLVGYNRINAIRKVSRWPMPHIKKLGICLLSYGYAFMGIFCHYWKLTMPPKGQGGYSISKYNRMARLLHAYVLF